MKLHLIKTNMSVIQKICLAGLFIALVTVLQKVVAINYLAFAPFMRISLGGPALIMFSSVLLGPVYGMIVGIASDLLGYLVFDASGYPPFLQITAIYAVLGFVSYFVFSLVFSIRNRKVLSIIEIVVMTLIWALVAIFTWTKGEIFGSSFELGTLGKTLVCVISGVIFLAVILFSILFKPKDKSVLASPLHICFASFICDFFVLLLFGSVMKAWAFGFGTFLTIFVVQAFVLFFNVFIDTFFILGFLRFTRKYFVED